MKSNNHRTPPPDIILGALCGNALSIEQMLHFYEPYINKLCTMYIRDTYGNLANIYIDEDRKQIVSFAFIRGIIHYCIVSMVALQHS